jgi:hypothetical protein
MMEDLLSSKNPEYWQTNRKMDELKEGLQKKLEKEDSKLLDTIFDLYHATESMEITASFEYGFRLGAALMVEVLADREELIRPKDYLMK